MRISDWSSDVCSSDLVDALVSRLLHAVEARKWLSQQSDLPLLAEASPRAFLEAVELDLRSDDPQLLAMLRPVKSGGFDSPDRTGLLWALEVRSEEHTSELQSLMRISYAVFCLKKKRQPHDTGLITDESYE